MPLVGAHRVSAIRHGSERDVFTLVDLAGVLTGGQHGAHGGKRLLYPGKPLRYLREVGFGRRSAIPQLLLETAQRSCSMLSSYIWKPRLLGVTTDGAAKRFLGHLGPNTRGQTSVEDLAHSHYFVLELFSCREYRCRVKSSPGASSMVRIPSRCRSCCPPRHLHPRIVRPDRGARRGAGPAAEPAGPVRFLCAVAVLVADLLRGHRPSAGANRRSNAARGPFPSWCTACGRNTRRAFRNSASSRRRGSTATSCPPCST